MTDQELQFNDGTGQLGKIEKKEQTLVLSSPTKHVGRWIVDRSLKLAGLDPYRDYSVRGTDIRTAADYILQLETDFYLLRQELEAIKAREVRLIQFIYEKFQPVRPLGIDGAEAIIAEFEKGENEDTK